MAVRITATLSGHLHVDGRPVTVVAYDRAACTVRISEEDEWTGAPVEREATDLRDFELAVVDRCMHPVFGPADVAEKTTEIKEAS